MPELTISPEKVGFLIEKARQFDVKEAASDPDSGSNASDDDMIDVLEDDGRDSSCRPAWRNHVSDPVASVVAAIAIPTRA